MILSTGWFITEPVIDWQACRCAYGYSVRHLYEGLGIKLFRLW